MRDSIRKECGPVQEIGKPDIIQYCRKNKGNSNIHEEDVVYFFMGRRLLELLKLSCSDDASNTNSSFQHLEKGYRIRKFDLGFITKVVVNNHARAIDGCSQTNVGSRILFLLVTKRVTIILGVFKMPL